MTSRFVTLAVLAVSACSVPDVSFTGQTCNPTSLCPRPLACDYGASFDGGTCQEKLADPDFADDRIEFSDGFETDDAGWKPFQIAPGNSVAPVAAAAHRGS